MAGRMSRSPESSCSPSMTRGCAASCGSTGTSARARFHRPPAGASRPAMIVISGASGNLGRATALRVADIGGAADGLVLASRSPDALDGLVEGATTRFADFDEPDTLREAFAGATRLLLISTSRV